MIVRMWTGCTLTEQAEPYEHYAHQVALPGYAETPGNRGVLMLRRDLPSGRSEFTMVSLWDGYDSIRAFAGDDIDAAVFYDRDDEFLVDRELAVRHYRVYGATAELGRSPSPR